MKKTILSLLLALVTISAANAQQTASISIDANTRFQHVTGFGGFSPSPTWSYWLSDSDMDKLFGKGDSQLGLNILRVYISSTSNGWGSSLANIKRAKKYGAFVFASPWSPQASWKSNNSESNGGSLLESRYADWAKYLNDYYLYTKNNGAEIDAVSIQNEPDWNATYQSCIWTGTQMAKFLREQGSKIQCKIIAPEAIHFTKSMHEPILNDDDACAQLDILGGHFYGWDGSSYPLAAQKGKEVWMTEYLINERQQNDNINIDWKTDGFLFARSINDAMLANMSAWVHYSLKRYYGCLGDGNYGTTDNAITKRGYVLSHYAKYVSGTTRIRHSLVDDTNTLTASAYLSQTGDSVIVMIINGGAQAYDMTINLPFYTKGGRRIVTNTNSNMLKSSLSFGETYSPVQKVYAYSVNTLIYVKSAERSDVPQPDVDAEPVFKDNFDLYGSGIVPPGWQSMSDNGLRKAGEYSLGPRMMSFSVEGAMNYGFYFRSATNTVGYLTYGAESAYRLRLAPGKYTLSYSTVGWKDLHPITCYVQTTGGSTVKSTTVTPKYSVSANGSSTRIASTTDVTMDFEISTDGNYILKWQLPQSSAGYFEALLGNVKLVKHDDADGIIDVNAEKITTDDNCFTVGGIPVGKAAKPGLYIRKGSKIIVR